MIKKLLLLVNPFSGKGKSKEAAQYLMKELPHEEWSFELVESQYKGFFTKILPEKELKFYEYLVVIGGDGTMNEVVNGIANRTDAPPILLFPCGTGNSFNHDLECLTWQTALERLKVGNTKKIDVFRINSAKKGSILSFNVSGWGLVSRINLLAEKLRFLGKSRYSVASLIYIFINPKFRAKLTVDNQLMEDDFSFILICNNKFTGTGMKMAPYADFSDGLLDVLIIRHISVIKMLQLFPKIFSGQHVHSPYCDFRTARSISINAEPLVLVVDGEITSETPLEIQIIDRKVEMLA